MSLYLKEGGGGDKKQTNNLKQSFGRLILGEVKVLQLKSFYFFNFINKTRERTNVNVIKTLRL